MMITREQANSLQILIRAVVHASDQLHLTAELGSDMQLSNALSFYKGAKKELDEYIESLVKIDE